ncbi:MAG TPA: Hsp20/alpha crystallin family protein [Candidatus Binataceae bacterium]|nr:Hsp20/alpha crystallin family protein [Candidatus Binataceae bacterium]
MSDKRTRRRVEREDAGPAAGFVKGLTELIEKLGDLAETGRELRKSGELTSDDDKMKAVYGLRVKLGLGGDAVEAEPFGNLKFDRESRQAVVQEIREPLVDVVEEPNRILVIAEMPGVRAEDVSLTIDHDVMVIEARRKNRRYRKEVLLPKPVLKHNTSISCNNGIVQIECRLE